MKHPATRKTPAPPPGISDVLSRSRQPLYLQLASEFRRQIRQGVWAEGSQIPSLEELMRDYQVARMTLRHALGILESEGLIRRSRGQGTFVNAHNPSVTELQLPTTWDETVALSDVLSTQSILEGDRAVQTLPELGMECSAQAAPRYRYLCRLHVKDGVPYCFSEVYIAETLYMKHKAEFAKGAAASVLARIPGLKLSQARQKITIGGAGLQSAKALNLPMGASIAELTRYACEGDRIIYVSRLEFPTQFVKIELDLLR